jgi:hypothetical protein
MPVNYVFYDREDLPYVELPGGELVRVSDCCEQPVTVTGVDVAKCQGCGGVLAPEYASEPHTDHETHRLLARSVHDGMDN